MRSHLFGVVELSTGLKLNEQKRKLQAASQARAARRQEARQKERQSESSLRESTSQHLSYRLQNATVTAKAKQQADRDHIERKKQERLTTAALAQFRRETVRRHKLQAFHEKEEKTADRLFDYNLGRVKQYQDSLVRRFDSPSSSTFLGFATPSTSLSPVSSPPPHPSASDYLLPHQEAVNNRYDYQFTDSPTSSTRLASHIDLFGATTEFSTDLVAPPQQQLETPEPQTAQQQGSTPLIPTHAVPIATPLYTTPSGSALGTLPPRAASAPPPADTSDLPLVTSTIPLLTASRTRPHSPGTDDGRPPATPPTNVTPPKSPPTTPPSPPTSTMPPIVSTMESRSAKVAQTPSSSTRSSFSSSASKKRKPVIPLMDRPASPPSAWNSVTGSRENLPRLFEHQDSLDAQEVEAAIRHIHNTP